MAPLLEANGLLTEADLPAFAIYCQSYSDYVRTTLELRTQGESVPDKFGSLKKNPLLSSKAQAYATLQAMLQQFGFTPNARQKIVSQATQENKDDLQGTNWF